MSDLLVRPLLLATLLGAALAPAVTAQGGMTHAAADTAAGAMPLFAGALGPFSRGISSDHTEAQAFFDQGFQLKYAFAVDDAARSFREAWQRDPECAICYWGEAWALGSYLNGRMADDAAARAYEASRKAASLAKRHASPAEQALIGAMAKRYPRRYTDASAARGDSAYATAMGEVYRQYPEDVDVATLYAEALYLLQPRRGLRDLEDPAVARLNSVLEGVLAADIRHPGACHLYVHSTESSEQPELAEACAEHLGNSIPGASHINHMPSHTWNQVGRWGDAVRANLQAWHSDQKAAAGQGFPIYPSHNLHMLLFAASMDGQGGIATQAAKDYAKLTGNPVYRALTLVRFGRFDEVIELGQRPEDPVSGGMWDFARGYSHLRAGIADSARTYLTRVQATADSSEAQFRFHPAKLLLGALAGILEGELHLAGGETEAGIAALQRAVATEDQLQYDEPEPLPFAARHWLGAALLDAGQFAEAEAVYRDELGDHPHNGWSLAGLRAALAGQNKPVDDVDAEIARRWARADTWLRGSRF